ncbi:MAG: isoamylase early set domain-containing protein [Anaerolineae bacterium]|nr:isoamylase early set domain-containing protein [Anaerolineae bacterium]
MLQKTYSKTGTSCRVTFKYIPPQDMNAETVYLVGEFNDWDRARHEMKKRRAGYYSTTITLEPGREYRYKYLVNGAHWINDDAADGYAPNDQGSSDSLVKA